MTTKPTHSHVSPDGHWAWNGTQWVPNPSTVPSPPAYQPSTGPNTAAPNLDANRGAGAPGTFANLALITGSWFGLGMGLATFIFTRDMTQVMMVIPLAGVLFGVIYGWLMRQDRRFLPGTTLDAVTAELTQHQFLLDQHGGTWATYRYRSGFGPIKDQLPVTAVQTNGGVDVKGPQMILNKIG